MIAIGQLNPDDEAFDDDDDEDEGDDFDDQSTKNLLKLHIY